MRFLVLFFLMIPFISVSQNVRKINNRYFDDDIYALQKEKYKTAIRKLKKEIKLNPDHSESYYFLGICQQNNYPFYSSKQSKSIYSFDKYIGIHPKDLRGYFRRGLVFLVIPVLIPRSRIFKDVSV